jgi:hypothetical protein
MLSTDYTAEGNLNDPSVIYEAGITKCVRAGGGWTGGCFYSTDACVMDRWAIKCNPNKFANVYGITENNYSPIIQVNFTDATGSHISEEFYPVVGADIVVPGLSALTIQLIGVLSVPDVNLAPYKVRFDLSDSKYSLSLAAEANVPVPYFLGDIQGQSVFSLSTWPATQTSKFATDIQRNSGSFSTPGFDSNKVDLPALHLGRMWYVENGNLVSNDTGLVPLLVAIKTSSSMSLVRKIAQVCPRLTIDSTQGCFNCPQGFSLNITAYSTCLPGLVTVSSSDVDITTKYLTIDTESQTYLVKALSGLQHASGSITLTAGDKTATATFVATLDFWTTVTNTTGIIAVANRGSTSDGSVSDFWDFMSNVAFAGWMSGTLSTLITLIVTVMIAVFAFKIFNRLSDKCMKKDTKKL